MPTPAELAAAAKEAQIARATARMAANGQTPGEQQQNPEPAPAAKPPEPEAKDSVDASAYALKIAELEQQLAAANGRVAPTQQQLSHANAVLEETRRIQALREAELEAKLKDMQEQLEAQANKAAADYRSVLTPEELAAIDESQLAVVAKLAAAQTDAKLAKLREEQKKEFARYTAEQENKARVEYLNYVLNDPTRKLGELVTLGNDTKFNAWLQTDEGMITDMAIKNMLNAPKQDIDRLARVVAKGIEKFKGPEAGALKAALEPDLPTRLAEHVKRQESVIDPTKIANMAAQIKRLSASRNSADRKKAAELLAQMRSNK